jgi:hypothetical protein
MENATAEEIHKGRGFPSAVWKSLANNARLSHIFTPARRIYFLKGKKRRDSQNVVRV